MNEENENNRVGRPFKMTNWLPALKEVLRNNKIVFLTHEDLVFLVNQSLPPEDHIGKRTFQNWFSGKFAPTDEMGKEFISLIKEALIREKMALGEALQNDKTGQWVRYAWILERKFEEFNLKHISENINKNEETQIIQITAGSEEQKKLIENLINVDYQEIKPLEIKQKNDVEETDNKTVDYEF